MCKKYKPLGFRGLCGFFWEHRLAVLVVFGYFGYLMMHPFDGVFSLLLVMDLIGTIAVGAWILSRDFSHLEKMYAKMMYVYFEVESPHSGSFVATIESCAASLAAMVFLLLNLFFVVYFMLGPGLVVDSAHWNHKAAHFLVSQCIMLHCTHLFSKYQVKLELGRLAFGMKLKVESDIQ